MTITELVASIDQRLADLDTELADLTRAHDALVAVQVQEAPPRTRRIRRPAAPAKSAAPAKPAAPAKSAASTKPATAEPAATTKPRRARRAPAKPRYEVVPAGKLISLLGDSEGMSTRDLARATCGDPAQVLALLKEQEDAKLVRRSGVRAATRWHVITDEDRIAARVAELEASSRRARARRN